MWACLDTRRAYVLTTVGWSVTTALVLALSRGQDFNWDQRNYHLSTPHLLLGNFWTSVVPSGIQSFYNPAVLLVQFLLIRHLTPMLAAAVIALCQAGVFVLAGLICACIVPPRLDSPGYGAAFLGFLLCLASPMALSEVGTTYIDLLTAVPVLLAYLLLLPGTSQPGPALVAGLLLGAATGFKLTNAVYVAGAAGFLLAGRPRITGVLATGAGVLACWQGFWGQPATGICRCGGGSAIRFFHTTTICSGLPMRRRSVWSMRDFWRHRPSTTVAFLI